MGRLTAGALRAARPRAPRRWAAAVLLCCTGAAHAAVEEDSTHRPYPVQVRPGESLRAALHAATPISVGGQRFHGYTRWDVRWSFRWWREASGRCAITEVTTRLRTEVQLPELRGAGAAQQAAFDRYLTALSQHEQGHVQIGRDAAQAIDQALRQMPAAPDCATLERDANAVAQRLLRDHVEREKQYDVRTRHGASQGARLD
ncbi:DUF922 domain-containing Zn-dependent protease [Paracidovorax sp. MALMAid1276]|uniref:DUF922 domain-containing Zn-dependent protease n=1 Tax=Paracidovorax sp. MALMAid1276 TaxID=3411631 RepID=UPI003B9A6443